MLPSVDGRLEAIAGPPTVNTGSLPSSSSDGSPLGAGLFGDRTLVVYMVNTVVSGQPIARFGPAVVGYTRTRLFAGTSKWTLGHASATSELDVTITNSNVGTSNAVDRLGAIRVAGGQVTGWAGRLSVTQEAALFGDGYTSDIVRLESAGRLVAWPKALTDAQVLSVMRWLARRYGIAPP